MRIKKTSVAILTGILLFFFFAFFFSGGQYNPGSVNNTEGWCVMAVSYIAGILLSPVIYNLPWVKDNRTTYCSLAMFVTIFSLFVVNVYVEEGSTLKAIVSVLIVALSATTVADYLPIWEQE